MLLFAFLVILAVRLLERRSCAVAAMSGPPVLGQPASGAVAGRIKASFAGTLGSFRLQVVVSVPRFRA